MSGGVFPAALAALPSVDLASLDSVARLQTRRDRKYIVPIPDAIRLAELLPASSRVLTIDGLRAFRYESVYLDTPELVSYLGAARGRRGRWKVRTRLYVDTGRSVLEIKRRGARGRTVKSRIDHASSPHGGLDEAGRRFLSACRSVGEDADRLRPALCTAYRRSTLLLPDGARVTIDVDLSATADDGASVRLAGMAVVETKSHGSPCAADRVLWCLGHRPVRFSKYATGLAALRPHLPSNRWRRALQLSRRLAPPRCDSQSADGRESHQSVCCH